MFRACPATATTTALALLQLATGLVSATLDLLGAGLYLCLVIVTLVAPLEAGGAAGLSAEVGGQLGPLVLWSLVVALMVQVILGLGNPQPASVAPFYLLTVAYFCMVQVWRRVTTFLGCKVFLVIALDDSN